VKIGRKTSGSQIYFLVSELDPEYYETLRGLGFTEMSEGFGRPVPANAPHLDRIFATFRRNAVEMILQAARVHPTPWEDALGALLDKMKRPELDWWLVGSTSLAVRSLDVVPRDIDLVVRGDGAHALAELLRDHLVEPVQETQGWVARWFGRAFLGARVEWIGGVHETVDEPYPRTFGPYAGSLLETVVWRGRTLRVPPLAFQLREDERLGHLDRAEKIKRAMLA